VDVYQGHAIDKLCSNCEIAVEVSLDGMSLVESIARDHSAPGMTPVLAIERAFEAHLHERFAGACWRRCRIAPRTDARLTHLQIRTNPAQVLVREESDWVSDISVTGAIRRRRQHALMFTECSLVMFGMQAIVFSPWFKPDTTRWLIAPAFSVLAAGLFLVPWASDFMLMLVVIGAVAASAGILSPILTYWISAKPGSAQGWYYAERAGPDIQVSIADQQEIFISSWH